MRRLICITAVALCLSPAPHAAELTVAGAWTLNRDLTQLRPEGEREAGRGAGMGAGRGRRIGGIGGRGLGSFGGAKPDEDNRRRVEAIRRRLTDIPDRLIITRSTDGVSITDGVGRSYSLKTDGKKQDRVTGDGEFTSKSRFDGARLIVEDDFDGPRVTTTYTPILDGGEITRLVVTLKAENLPDSARERLAGPRRAARELRRVYDLDTR